MPFHEALMFAFAHIFGMALSENMLKSYFPFAIVPICEQTFEK